MEKPCTSGQFSSSSILPLGSDHSIRPRCPSFLPPVLPVNGPFVEHTTSWHGSCTSTCTPCPQTLPSSFLPLSPGRCFRSALSSSFPQYSHTRMTSSITGLSRRHHPHPLHNLLPRLWRLIHLGLQEWRPQARRPLSNLPHPTS
jgi:hypothetical protein